MQVLGIETEVGDRQEIGGLGVYPLTGVAGGGPAYVTGPEAFGIGLVEVSELEPPEVQSVLANNLAEVPLLLVEGEMLVGGNQNRTVNVTVLCPPKSATIVPVTCVEAGRWGAWRAVSGVHRHAPGSLRSVKTATLGETDGGVPDRSTDQHQVWHEVGRQAGIHQIESETSALDDIQGELEARLAVELDALRAAPDHIGVVCTAGDDIVGLDLFDEPSTLSQYLRGIVAGHSLDVTWTERGRDQLRAIERFLAGIDAATRETRAAVGLGEEVLLHGPVTGVGLMLGGRLVHLAAFPPPAGRS